jgi:hypothetical protein
MPAAAAIACAAFYLQCEVGRTRIYPFRHQKIRRTRRVDAEPAHIWKQVAKIAEHVL